MKRGEKIVITGMGVISPLGHTVKDFWNNLLSGKCGIKKIKSFDTSDLPTQIAGEIDDFNPLRYMDKKMAKRSARVTKFALASAQQAIKSAELEVNDDNRFRIGVYVASGTCSFSDYEKAVVDEYINGWEKMRAFMTIQDCYHSMAFTIACHYQITGPTITISTACNSSSHALEIATDQIRLHKVDKALVIGSETLSEFVFKGFCKTRAMSIRNTAPLEASRPFDRDRDGFVVSEGAGSIILEREKEARKRGATLYAEVAGCASTNDAYSLLCCEPTGQQMSHAMIMALREAQIDKEKIAYISAHGPGMPDTDRAETYGIKRVFGDWAQKLNVSSIKGTLGSPIGATNIFQIIASSLAINEQVIPPTINYDTPDPECDLDYVPWNARDIDLSYVLINSHAYGGGNSSVVLAMM
jgi:3-oxoacyl-[acyl-carrier-protein] synthase II